MSTSTAAALDVAAVSERYFAAWADCDPGAIAALHTEDTTFWVHAGQEPVRGRAAAREAFAQLFELFPGFGFDVHRVLLGERHWVLDWTLTWEPPGGGEGRLDCVDAVVVADDGLVARKDTFVDAAQLRVAFGGPASAAPTSGEG